jgi:hypothetical protein
MPTPLRHFGRAVLRFLLAILGPTLFLHSLRAAEARQTENIILISLDGVRTEEMFAGADLEVLRSATQGKTAVEQTPLYKKYWAASAEERRLKVMPFFWGTLMQKHGSIAGNRNKGSIVQVMNRHRFSYPGYSEILTGEARDGIVKSNDKVQNPQTTVLEFLKDELRLSRSRVAVFASWDVFDYIAESKPGTITINSGFEAYNDPSSEVQSLNRLQLLTRTPWDSVRHDIYTFRFGMTHLKTHQPRVFYLTLGETDDWAHDQRYDRVLQALEMTDDFFRQLWEFLENHDQYRGKTTLLITTDHGRGTTASTWPHHNAQTEGAQYIWLAVVSPDIAMRGEWANTETIFQNQIAATMCRFLGIDFNRKYPSAGRPVRQLFPH